MCDRCGKLITDNENRVIMNATKYTLYDSDSETPVTSSSPPGTMTPTGVSVPQNVSGSTAQFIAEPAFNGQLEMHEQCWDTWFVTPAVESTVSTDRDAVLARRAEEGVDAEEK